MAGKMEMALNIPEIYQVGLSKIASVPNDAYETLLAALSAAPPLPNAKRLAEHIAPTVPSIQPQDLFEIISTAMAVIGVKGQGDVSIDEFTATIIGGVKSWRDFDAVRRAEIRTRLIALLDSKTLNYAAKASVIQKFEDRVFSEARVLTDVRPVFADDPGSPLMGGMVIHNLKITYFQDREFKDFYVALDDADVESLRKALARAEAKSRNLSSWLNKSGVRHLDTR